MIKKISTVTCFMFNYLTIECQHYRSLLFRDCIMSETYQILFIGHHFTIQLNLICDVYSYILSQSMNHAMELGYMKCVIWLTFISDLLYQFFFKMLILFLVKVKYVPSSPRIERNILINSFVYRRLLAVFHFALRFFWNEK